MTSWLTNEKGQSNADPVSDATLLHVINSNAIRIDDDGNWAKHLASKISDKRVVLIGEASHGTHEFYSLRAELTKTLIQEHGFNAVGIEGDWPDAFQVNQFVKGKKHFPGAAEALSGFKRFPTWMWRNLDVEDFVTWLREHNSRIRVSAEDGKRHAAGFYGLDLYSLYSSVSAVLKFLEKNDPEKLQDAVERYGCFDHMEPQQYGFAVSFGVKGSCKGAAMKQLLDLEVSTFEDVQGGDNGDDEEYLSALQNARSVKGAEEYYRAMFETSYASWNVRDSHMFETLQHLLDNLDKRHHGGQKKSKVIVWAHNSHVGDSMATEMSERREINIGRLSRKFFGPDAFLLGFSTFSGTVMAARKWDEAGQERKVREALPQSWEDLFHRSTMKNFLLMLSEDEEVQRTVDRADPRLQRAIGVVYQPQTERISHYYHTKIHPQFDAIIHVDTSSAVDPLK